MDDTFKKALVDALPRARNYARTLARSEADADDLVHEAIERALKRSRHLRSGQISMRGLIGLSRTYF